MTIAEQFRMEGIEQGMQQGMQQGIEQGMQQGVEEQNATIAKRLLAENVDIALIAKVTQLPIAEIEQLEVKAH